MVNPGISAQLDPDEQLVAHAYSEMSRLVGELARAPVNRLLYTQVQEFLDGCGLPACAALDRIAGRGPQHLRARLEMLLGLEPSC